MKLRIHKIVIWPLCLFLFVGLVFVGNSDFLCVGEDGYIEFDTEYLPFCGGTDDVCKVDVSNDLHDEHHDCTNCLDLTLNGPLLSRRFTKISQIKSVKLLTPSTFYNSIILASTYKSNSQVDKFLLIFGQSPQSAFIAATILRC